MPETYNTENYKEQGGSTWVVGGELNVTGDFKLDGETVVQAANQADSVADSTALIVADFNALLAKLKTAGLMVDDE
jgi:hypothetical protein